jgi:hypothetical protein
MTLYTTWLSISFIWSYCRFAQAVPNLREKKELKTVFQLFWNSINQQMMDYHGLSKIISDYKNNIYLKSNPIRALTDFNCTSKESCISNNICCCNTIFCLRRRSR